MSKNTERKFLTVQILVKKNFTVSLTRGTIHNGQKFTDKSLENAGLSVKCGLLTDKQAKNAALSVKLSEILDRLVEQYCRLKKVVFIHCKLKMPDKISRKRTDFVRHFI